MIAIKRFPIIRACLLRNTQSLTSVRQYSSDRPYGLKIAYFGSDNFSVKSLGKLLAYKRANSKAIESIHVITRSAKSRGRKSKVFADNEIGSYCQSVDHRDCIRADTASEISNLVHTHKFDLAIAVAFGVLIPEDFINSCKYGGINVHPSLLPRHSGASPIQYTLMNNDPYTGCTIQTLHPTKFDRGDILLQSNEIPVHDGEDYRSLEDKLANMGSEMLIQVIDKELYDTARKVPIIRSKYKFSPANKISPSKSQIIWNEYSSSKIKSLGSALGPLFSYKFVEITKKKSKIKDFRKVDFDDIAIISKEALSSELVQNLKEPGQFQLDDSSESNLIIKTKDGFISVGKIKFECYNEESPIEFVRSLKKRSGSTSHIFLEKSKLEMSN